MWNSFWVYYAEKVERRFGFCLSFCSNRACSGVGIVLSLMNNSQFSLDSLGRDPWIMVSFVFRLPWYCALPKLNQVMMQIQAGLFSWSCFWSTSALISSGIYWRNSFAEGLPICGGENS